MLIERIKITYILCFNTRFNFLLLIMLRLVNSSFFRILLTFLFYFLFSPNASSQLNDEKFVVVLDAGHGGKDSGNRGNRYYEKKIALKIALGIGKILEKNSLFKVIYTRKKDVFVNLIERAQIANKADADLFISIHCDSHNSKAFGAGTFVLGLHANQRNFEIAKKENNVIFYEENYEENYDGFDPNNPESVISLTLMQETYLDQSIIAADAIQKRFVKNLSRKDRTVKQAGFIVLKYTYMPSVLVETGFLTNKKEGSYLNYSKGQNQIAKAIAMAIIDYMKIIKFSLNKTVEFKNKEKKSELVGLESVTFKVQLAASYNNLATKSYNFKGLSPISKEREGKLYRYYLGSVKSYKIAKKLKKKAVKSGYKSAFIVSFLNGKKTKLSEVID